MFYNLNNSLKKYHNFIAFLGQNKITLTLLKFNKIYKINKFNFCWDSLIIIFTKDLIKYNC